MASEIQAIGQTGKTLYCLVRSATAQPYNTVTPAFEAYTVGNYASYAITLTEQSTTGYYVGTFPVGITTYGIYNLDVRLQVGGSPVVSDPPVLGAPFNWTGAQEVQTGNLFKATPLSLAPTKGYMDEAMAVIRALARGKKIENVGGNSMAVYAADDSTVLFTITYSPSIAAPTATTVSP